MAIMLSLFMESIASAVTFSNLYVFGDSLSDSGQFPDIFAGLPSLRATNRIDSTDPTSETGMVWSQCLSRFLGLGELLPSTPLLGGPSGNNYAVLGLRSNDILASITEPNGSVVGFASRDGYLIEYPQADPHALYVVWGGGDDLRDIRDVRATGGDPVSLVTDSQRAADNIMAGIDALHLAGARYILVPNMPGIGDIPESHILGDPAYVNAGNDAANAFNDRLLARLNASGANVIQVDVNSLFREFLNDPAAFGFSTEDHRIVAFDSTAFTQVPAAEGLNGANSQSPDPSGYIFFDGIHPTTYAAEIPAMYYQSILVAPGQVSILAEMPLYLARGHLNGIENHLKAMHSTLQNGKFVPFVNGGYTYLDVDNTDDTPGYENGHYSLTTGLSYRFSENLLTGLALGHHTAGVDYDDDLGDFDFDGIFLSLLSRCQYSDLILDVIGTVADLDYNDINRKVRLGPALRTHKGDTGGDYYAVKMFLKLDLFNHKGFTMGPIASINYQRVCVDGFRENGSLSTSMNFYDQVRRSLLGGVGMFIAYDTQTFFGHLQFYNNVAYEKEFKDDKRYVHAGVNTLQGSSFELPAYEPESSFWSFDLGLNTALVKDWLGGISYSVHKGNEDSMMQCIHLMIQVSF